MFLEHVKKLPSRKEIFDFKQHDVTNEQQMLKQFEKLIIPIRNKPDKICNYISKLIDKQVSLEQILEQIDKFYYLSSEHNENFKQALIKLNNEGMLKKFFECGNEDVSNRIADAYIHKLDTIDFSDVILSNLPKSIGNLQRLERLDLRNNQLVSIPDSIGNLQGLKTLDLDNNQLTNLPESIGNLQRLERLDLRNNQLVSIPDSIGNLQGLKTLDLYNNQLSNLPESIGNLQRLKRLDLKNNRLTGIPDSIGNLQGLKTLDLDNNQLSNLPESIGNLQQLEQLDLDNNLLTNLPESIGNLQQLEQLDLSNNQLTIIPDSIGNLQQLEQLDLDNNLLTNLPESIGNLQQLEQLDLSNNQLTIIPDSIRDLQIFNMDFLNTRGYEYNNSNMFTRVTSLRDIAIKLEISKEWHNTFEWDKMENEYFTTFIDKIWITNDVRKDESLKNLIATMINIFDKMESSQAYRDECLNIAEESVNSCGDRIALGLVQMQLAQKAFPDHEPSVKELFDYEKTMIKADKIFKIARDKVIEKNNHNEEIETYLMYFSKLKDVLGIQINGMLYERCSMVTDADIQRATESIANIEDKDVFERLIENPTIKKKFQSEFNSIQSNPEFEDSPLIGENDLDYYVRVNKLVDSLKQKKIELLGVWPRFM
jgi:Leucine-rich repeat (LRR) protein